MAINTLSGFKSFTDRLEDQETPMPVLCGSWIAHEWD